MYCIVLVCVFLLDSPAKIIWHEEGAKKSLANEQQAALLGLVLQFERASCT